MSAFQSANDNIMHENAILGIDGLAACLLMLRDVFRRFCLKQHVYTCIILEISLVVKCNT